MAEIKQEIDEQMLMNRTWCSGNDDKLPEAHDLDLTKAGTLSTVLVFVSLHFN